jgi:hypothetical protein
MLRLLADENFNDDSVRGLWLRQPDLDMARVPDAGLAGADDPDVLAWAAEPPDCPDAGSRYPVGLCLASISTVPN